MFARMSESLLLLPTPMNQCTVLNCWSELPPELLDLVARSLTNYVDYIRLRAVCPSWRSNLPRKPYRLLTQLPWLLLPHYNNITISEAHCSFFNLADSKAYRLELLDVLGEDKRCWGSPHGWLVTLHEEGHLLSLLNPLTKDQIHLPSLFFFPSTFQNGEVGNIILPWDSIGYLRNSYIVKAVLFANPSVSTDFDVMVIMQEGPCGLAFFRSGTEAWTLITDTEGIVFYDVVCFEGQFYAVDGDGNVYICNLNASPNVAKVADPPEALIDNEPEQKYLVESNKELLLVYRCGVQIQDTSPDSTYHFTVHKLDLRDSTWSKVNDLGHQVLFLGTNCSFSLPARVYPCCRENSIYFTDDKRYPTDTVGDFGVFNLNDGGGEPLPACPAPKRDNIKYMLPPPVWVTFIP